MVITISDVAIAHYSSYPLPSMTFTQQPATKFDSSFKTNMNLLKTLARNIVCQLAPLCYYNIYLRWQEKKGGPVRKAPTKVRVCEDLYPWEKYKKKKLYRWQISSSWVMWTSFFPEELRNLDHATFSKRRRSVSVFSKVISTNLCPLESYSC